MKKLCLENIKAFKNTGEIEIAPITIIVGQNSCGKSSFIRFPVVLAQTLNSPYAAKDSISLHLQQPDTIDYGNFEDVVHGHNGDCFSVKITFNSVSVHDNGLNYWLLPEGKNDLSAKLTFSKFDLRVCLTGYEVFIGEFSIFSIKRNKKNGFVFAQTHSIKDNQIVSVNEKYNLTSNDIVLNITAPLFLPSMERKICMKILKVNKTSAEKIMNALDKTINFYSDKGDNFDAFCVREDLKKLILNENVNENDACLMLEAWNDYRFSEAVCKYIRCAFRSNFSDLQYIGPIRATPERVYRRNEGASQYVGLNGEGASSILINDYLTSDRPIYSKVSLWLEKAFGYNLSIKELGGEYYQLAVESVTTHEKSNLMDVGYGISQILPILTQLALFTSEQNGKYQEYKFDEERRYVDLDALIVGDNKILIIEQPELHLHPAAQSKLAEVFSEAICLNKKEKNNQIIIETHSEHFIRALQILIAKEDCSLSDKMVKIYYVDRNKEGDSVINEMELNKYGQFTKRWPAGFFDEATVQAKEFLRQVSLQKYKESEKID